MSFAYRVLFLSLMVLFPSIASSQGLLVDIRPGQSYRLPRVTIHHGPRFRRPPQPPQVPQSYKIKELAVHANIDGQVAKVKVSQSFVNTGSRQMEVCFVFPLPYDGAVDRMTFMLDGKEFAAELLDAREARRIYEGYVRRNQDPALLEWLGTGMFKTSVFPVPPGAKRTVTMQYSQVCKKVDGLTEWLFPLSTAKYTSHPVEKVTVDLTIDSPVAIKNVYSPTHVAKIDNPSAKHAHVVFEAKNRVPSSDFRLLYDVGDQKVAASVLSYRPDSDDEGYFLLLVSPEIQRPEDVKIRKTVQFVVDRSGSMTGKKIEQAKGALDFVLNNLNEGDLFNVIAYDSTVESFRPELQRFNDETRAEAQAFVAGIYAGGSTNIDGALEVALGQLKDPKCPTYVVFLTDGLPTAGVRNESKIMANARSRNKVRARIFPFGVGPDVNSRLLDKMARSGFGQSNYVRPNEDIEEHVSRLYRRIGAPAMTEMRIQFDVEGLDPGKGSLVSRVYPKDAFDLFAGDQLVMVGRYKQHGDAKVSIRGNVDGTEQSFDFPARLVEKSADDSFAFIEKLWAVRRVGEIIDEIDLHGRNEELVNELVALATKHGILTPYTSFLADEESNLRELAVNRRRANLQLDELSLMSGTDAFGQRLLKGQMQRANLAPGSGFQEGYAYDSSRGGAAGMASGGSLATGPAGMSGPGPVAYPGSNRSRSGAGPSATRVPKVAASYGGPSNVVRTVLNVGTKTFFWKNDRWEDSTLTEENVKKVQKLERFSDDYFGLVKQFGRATAKYMAIDEEVIVVLGGQAYQF